MIIKTILKPSKLTKLFSYLKDYKPHVHLENLISEHKELRVPYQNSKLYEAMLDLSQSETDPEAEIWEILEKYFEFNREAVDAAFLARLSMECARVGYLNYKIWIYLEEYLLKNISELTNVELAMTVYSFGRANRGSAYLFEQLAESFLDRGVKTFSKDSFELLEEGFELAKYKEELLWLFIARAKIEIFNSKV